MGVLSVPAPGPAGVPLFRISVEQYHEMIRNGILQDGDPVELLEGVLTFKVTKKPRHWVPTQTLRDLLPPMLPKGWFVNDQEPLTTSDSEPEPDLSIVRGDRASYFNQENNPGPEDVGLIIEVAHTTLPTDQGLKKRVYARAGIKEYWIVNVVNRRIEVYAQPTGPCDEPTYNHRQDFAPGDDVPVRLEGNEIGRVRVSDLIPSTSEEATAP